MRVAPMTTRSKYLHQAVLRGHHLAFGIARHQADDIRAGRDFELGAHGNSSSGERFSGEKPADILWQLGPGTGGKFLNNTNDLGGAFAKLVARRPRRHQAACFEDLSLASTKLQKLISTRLKPGDR